MGHLNLKNLGAFLYYNCNIPIFEKVIVMLLIIDFTYSYNIDK